MAREHRQIRTIFPLTEPMWYDLRMQVQAVHRPIRFQFSPEKARAGILLMLESQGNHDLHEVLKACYFADKGHLNKHNRPIFGASYRAMKFGPVPLEIYEMLKRDPLWLAELNVNEFPWKLDGFQVRKTSNEIADMDILPRSDLECIISAHEMSSRMSFNNRTAATHGPDWQAANLGMMKYEDMLDDGPEKQEKIAYLREAAPRMKL